MATKKKKARRPRAKSMLAWAKFDEHGRLLWNSFGFPDIAKAYGLFSNPNGVRRVRITEVRR